MLCEPAADPKRPASGNVSCKLQLQRSSFYLPIESARSVRASGMRIACSESRWHSAQMLIRFVPAAALFFAAPAFAQEVEEPVDPAPDEPSYELTLVDVETSMGTFRVALETERAPITAGNFLRYVDEDRFDGTVFYRALSVDWGDQPNGFIQGGTQNHPDRILDPIAHEPTNVTGVTHGIGALSMARFAPGTATGDFSIMLQPQRSQDADPENEDADRQVGYAAFGHVVSGMEVVHAIHAAPIDPELGEGWMRGQMLADPVVILDMTRVEEAGESVTDQP